MLDIKLIRKHPETVRKDLEKRGEPEKIEMLNNLIKYDKQWRNLLKEANKLRHKRKLITRDSEPQETGKGRQQTDRRSKKLAVKTP
jgi:seryl-tRNA synthetase